ncbi:hypothetical protein [Cupriavidus basilensis]|uniref:hypothetical protein n=1 Tax=Cupriavidus basilensis TaxID=68895 RepID=UPI0039F726BB
MRTLILSACALVLTACVTRYPEPTSGDRARIRMVKTGPSASTSFHTFSNMPAGDCIKQGVELGEQRIALFDNPLVHYNASLGIPGNDAQASQRFSEAYIHAGRPFLLDAFVIGANVQNSYQCRVAALWSPESGADYEAVLHWTGSACQLTVSKVEAGGPDGVALKRPVDARFLKTCEAPGK